MLFNFLSLNLLIFSPILAAVVIASPLFGINPIYIRRFAKTFGTCHFIYTLLFVAFNNLGVGPFYNEINIFGSAWLSNLGINAAFGTDGLTVILVAMTSFIFLLALILSKTMIRTKHKMYYTLMFLLLSALLGTFCAKDMFVFLIFWLAELIPMYLLIAEWGTGDCKQSAMKYLMFTFFGSIFMLMAMISLYYYGYHANGELSSSIDFLRVNLEDGIFPLVLKKAIFWGFFIGFAVKLPVFPLHTWLTDVNSDSVPPVNMLFSAVLLNTACYGLIRFNLDLFPELFAYYAPILMIIAVVTIIWSSLCALKQKDIYKIVSYACVIYSGLFLLGLSTLTKAGIDGAILIMISSSLITAGLFAITGLVQQATKTKSLVEITGLGKSMPRLMNLSYFFVFATMAVPLTVNFPALWLITYGTYSADYTSELSPKIATVIVLTAVVVSGMFILKMFLGIFGGATDKKYNDITGHRLTVIIALVFFIVLFGCFPESIMNIYDGVSQMLTELLRA